MTDSRSLTSVISQFALACNLTTSYYMITMGENMPDWFFPQSMLVYAPLVYLLNRLFLRRERTMLSLSIFNCVLGGLMLAGYLLLEQWHGIAYLAFVTIFLAWLTVRGCRFSLNGPALRGTLLTLDSSFILLVAFSGYSAAAGLAPHWSIPALCGLSASIIAAATSRSSQPWGPKGWLAVGGAFGALFLLMWFFVGVAAAPAGQGLVAVWTLLISGANAVKQLILRFLAYLLSLLPDAEPGETQWYEAPEFTQMEEMPATEPSPIVSMIFFVFATVGAVIFVVWFLRHLGKIRLGRLGGEKVAAAPRRQRPSLLQGLLRLLSAWAAGLRLRLRLWNGRNTAVGLYFLLVHRCRRAPWHKRSGETPREFLLRLASAAQEDPQLISALEKLARETDAALYSGRPGRPKLEYAPMIRRRIGAAVKTQFVRSLLARLCPNRAKSPVSP